MCVFLTSNMSLEDTKHSPFQRQRNILYLISQYLSDFGLKQTKSMLWNEASLSPECTVCDNIDLDTIYLDFCSYYHLRFGKLPKILKRIECASSDSTNAKGKVNKNRSTENTTKTSDECKKKAKQESSELGPDDFVITSSISNSNESHNDDKKSETNSLKYRKSLDLFEPFSGEMRDLAYVIERQIVRGDNHIKWDDVQGNEHAKQTLIESVILPLKFPQLFTKLTKPWKGILLHGVSGVGKTLLAKALSSETFATVTFFNISASTLISKWRGESEKFVKVLFTMAKSCAPAIIFIDEFESLASKRDSSNDHEATKRFKNELLIQIDDLDSSAGNVLLLANSNLPWEIDEAFLRRFERKILIDLPSCENRADIMNQLLPTTKQWSVNKMNQLIEASDGFTGADLKIACKEASMIQIRNKLKSSNKSIQIMPEITFDDLLASMRQVKPSMAASATKHRQWHTKFGNQSD
ncbi:katanin p60 ATPase-containing subunit A-like 2 isoform X2 [Sitodiplosis mosellana]|uniref:katanin p60 ATPase-containing subunit A-like 2 isoform X2 n=1 Tax=Sitodiplosis mosellana TaxID=263140 RepID=UPI002443D970|nr:katanin p60 ATPase-containing subunit A-like 2 isoform X2 [Sitodiplosis mosellana]